MASGIENVQVAAGKPARFWKFVSAWLTWIVCTQWAATGLALLFIVPKFSEIFKQFNAKMPVLTAVVMEAYVVLAGLCGVVVALLVIKELACKDLGWRTRWNAIAFFAGVLSVALIMAALFLPMMAIMQSLMGGGSSAGGAPAGSP